MHGLDFVCAAIPQKVSIIKDMLRANLRSTGTILIIIGFNIPLSGIKRRTSRERRPYSTNEAIIIYD